MCDRYYKFIIINVEQIQGKSSVGMAPITDSNGNGTIKSNLYVPSGMGNAEDALRQAINKNTGATIGTIFLDVQVSIMAN